MKGNMQARMILLALLMGAATLYSFLVPPAAGFREPNMARIIFFHLPSAFVASVMIIAIGWLGITVLRRRDAISDIRLAAATELGMIFALATMATGIVFSRVQWGAWWQNDPRQVSFLVVCLMLLAGTALRAGIADDTKRALASGAYSVAMLVPAIFLTFVYPRLEAVREKSFHPSQTIQTGGFDTAYWIGILVIFLLLLVITRWLYLMRIRIGTLELELINGIQPDHRRSAAPDGVVRPVALHEES